MTTNTMNNLSSNATNDVSINWKGKRVAILGYGIEGTALVDFLSKKGANVFVLDRRQRDDLDQKLLSIAEQRGAQFVLGKKYLQNLTDYAFIFRSPGVRRLLPELAEAEKKGVIITSQTKLFFDLCPGKIIGVTGTKGKGTTATLIYQMLKSAGKSVFLGGNIGVPPITFLDKMTKESWAVVELSSFQLQDLYKSPHIAVMLMITSEHLDYHATHAEYVDAKRNILRFQTPDDYAVLNRDYPITHESDIFTDAKVFRVSRERETNDGCFVLGDQIIVRKDSNDDAIIKTSELKLPGRHNWENVCSAIMAVKLAGVGDKHIVSVLKEFSGLAHHLELVREVNGVRYYDDSFSTTPETAIAAIESFDAPKILILGGSSKKSDFTQLGKLLRESETIKAIIGIGDEWESIKAHIGTHTEAKYLLIEGAEDMTTVVKAAAKIGTKGDVVLLSPGCASFGMFKNYKDRGNQFTEAVKAL